MTKVYADIDIIILPDQILIAEFVSLLGIIQNFQKSVSAPNFLISMKLVK